MLKLVIFDLDGTLVEFKLDYQAAKGKILRQLEALGIKRNTVNSKSINEIVNKARSQLIGKTGENGFRMIKRNLYREIERFEVEAANKTRIFPGVLACLKYLRRRGLKLALVTNNHRKATELTLKRLNLNSFFDFIITRDDVEDFKPNPNQISKVLKEAAVSGKNAVYVGDSPMDVLTARNAGVKSIIIPYGIYSESEVKKYNPDFIAKNFHHLTELIESFLEDGNGQQGGSR